MNNEGNNKVDQILNSLDGSQRAAAPDFFYTRLKTKMEGGWERNKNLLMLRPAYALAALVIVLIVNVFVLLKGEQTSDNTTTTDTVQSIAAEYSLNDNNSLYDLTVDK